MSVERGNSTRSKRSEQWVGNQSLVQESVGNGNFELLPPGQQKTLNYRFLSEGDGFRSLSQTARALGKKINTVKTENRRGLIALGIIKEEEKDKRSSIASEKERAYKNMADEWRRRGSLNSLPDREIEVIMERYLRETIFSSKEVASKLGVNIHTVEGRKLRGLRKIARELRMDIP